MRFFFQDLLSPDEVSLSLGHRELLSLKKALLADCILPSSSVVWYTDSSNLVSFWEKGSPKPLIQMDVIETLLFCKDQSISLHVLHLPREDPRIQAADGGSRSFDKDDWGVDAASFAVLHWTRSRLPPTRAASVFTRVTPIQALWPMTPSPSVGHTNACSSVLRSGN